MDRNFGAMQIVIVVMVALRKESVDRNISEDVSYSIIIKSLSARRAWIEILCCVGFCLDAKGRSPQGERG